MLKKLIAVGVFCAVFLTQVLMGIADAAPKMAQNESVVQEGSVPEAAAGSVMQATGFTYVYASASTGSAKLLALGAGNKVQVLKDCGAWTQVNAAGRTGYVQTRYLTASGSATTSNTGGTAVRTGSVMQVTGYTYAYASASTGSAKLLALGAGNKVQVLKNCGAWTQVNAAGRTGYVQTRYLTVSGSATTSNTGGTAVRAGSVMQATGFTYVYASASTGSGKLLALGAGNKVQVKKDCGTWIQVIAAGRTGYVMRAYLSASSASGSSGASGNSSGASGSTSLKAGTVAQAVKTTYVRKSASPNGTKLLTLGTGNKVEVKSIQGSWTKVIAAGKTGYAYTSDLKPATSSFESATVPSSSTSKAEIYTDQVTKGVIKIKLVSHNGKKLKVMISKGSQTAYYNLMAATGYQTFPLNLGSGTYKVSVLENISGTSYKYIASKSVAVSGTGTSAYLISTSEIYFNSSMAPIQLAASLTNGKTTNSQKVAAVYNWVVNNIDYDRNKKPPAGYVPSIVNTYNTRKGICYDFAALFAAMLRSQGVPTKLVKGYADNVSGYHAWNEVYVNGSWHIVDTSYDAQVHGSMYKYSGYHKTSES